MTKMCPIYFGVEDGDHPCAFRAPRHGCGYAAASCIPMHMDRYKKSSVAHTFVCRECGHVMTLLSGELERGRFTEWECGECGTLQALRGEPHD